MHNIRWTIYTDLLLRVPVAVLAALLMTGAAQAQGKTKIRIATASPSLSYLPIYTALKRVFSRGAASVVSR